MTNELPGGKYDFSWCRWVASFVSDPALLIKRLAAVMPAGSVAIFHEYAHYTTWRFSPRLPNQEKFAQEVEESWRAAGGRADVALDLPPLLSQHGFRVRAATPRIFCVRPADYMWQWPARFVDIGLERLQELGRLDPSFSEKVRAEIAAAEASPDSFVLTPLFLEIIAEKIT